MPDEDACRTAARTGLRPPNQEESLSGPRREPALLDSDGCPREPRPHQRRVLRLFAERGIVFLVGSRIAPLPEPGREFFHGDDDFQFPTEVGGSREGNLAFRHSSSGPRTSFEARPRGLRSPISCLRSMAEGKEPDGKATGGTVAFVRILPISPETRENPGRSRIRWGEVCDCRSAPTADGKSAGWRPTRMENDRGSCSKRERTRRPLARCFP